MIKFRWWAEVRRQMRNQRMRVDIHRVLCTLYLYRLERCSLLYRGYREMDI
jgi:hypothetical protein